MQERKSCIEAYIEEHAAKKPDFPAVVVKHDITSYGEFWNMIKGFAEFLKRNGVGYGDIVVVKATQTLSYAVSYFGTHLAHASFAPAEKSITVSGLKNLINETKAKVCICDKVYDEIKSNFELLWLMPADVIQIAKDNFIASVSYSFPETESTADVFFTTGTTGASKGVEISHRA